ncbi:hypothetical protein MM221_19175 [Salipaludibacillus sp. LMS25]|jgi:hypothetical protein|uniref:hypothetical protein n=1 Tax=Salipaludibacillus sp. LMS25 TaxID=2924031 RepID=UPI0020D19444|nr:hypothetical protein [Salipaludibacillus sp. LMS25]UTR14645.1 hypothetical protein MM221_19175 [Salipaludibacillus sp. LMS25]
MKYVIQVHDGDNSTANVKKIIVEDGVVQIFNNSNISQRVKYVDTEGFTVLPGKVILKENVLTQMTEDDMISFSKHLFLHGFSTFIHLIEINYESETGKFLESSRHLLKKCPADYIHAVRLPLRRLTPSWVRKLKKLSVPLIVFTVQTEDDLNKAPWQRLIEAAFPLRMMFIFDQKNSDLRERQKLKAQQCWEQIVKFRRINSYFQLPEQHEALPLLFLKRMGLYPQKGTFDSGAHADYFMYWEKDLNETVEGLHLPDVIVLKGHVVKSGSYWFIEEAVGCELTSTMPEQFLSISEVHQYTVK